MVGTDAFALYYRTILFINADRLNLEPAIIAFSNAQTLIAGSLMSCEPSSLQSQKPSQEIKLQA